MTGPQKLWWWSCALQRAEVNRRAVVYARMRATWPTSNRVETCPRGCGESISAIVMVHTRHAGGLDAESKPTTAVAGQRWSLGRAMLSAGEARRTALVRAAGSPKSVAAVELDAQRHHFVWDASDEDQRSSS
jgi:hypothetical protein